MSDDRNTAISGEEAEKREVRARDNLGKLVTVTADRSLGSWQPKYGVIYPVNYGFAEGTAGGDGIGRTRTYSASKSR